MDLFDLKSEIDDVIEQSDLDKLVMSVEKDFELDFTDLFEDDLDFLVLILSTLYVWLFWRKNLY